MNPKVEWILKRPLYQRVLMMVGAALIFVAAWVYMGILPKNDELDRLVKQSEGLERQLVNDRRIASNLPVFKAEYEKMLAQLDKALTELPNDKEIPKLLTNIASSAKENGLDVLMFKPDKEVPKGFYAEVPVKLKLTGTFHEVAMFFFDVGTLPRIVNINNVSLGTSKQGDGSRNLSIDCLATTFRFLDKVEQQAAANPGKK